MCRPSGDVRTLASRTAPKAAYLPSTVSYSAPAFGGSRQVWRNPISYFRTALVSLTVQRDHLLQVVAGDFASCYECSTIISTRMAPVSLEKRLRVHGFNLSRVFFSRWLVKMRQDRCLVGIRRRRHRTRETRVRETRVMSAIPTRPEQFPYYYFNGSEVCRARTGGSGLPFRHKLNN
jgi:hypothetical protein